MSLLTHLPLLAAFNTDWLLANAGLVICILVGLLTLAFGLGDLLRFSPKRIWAISSVCFSESIRRRVLWITPLAIIGVMIVAQLQRPFDEQDAIRQTTKFCLFTTGMVVVLVAILLAATSLPKEIDNRVIFTIVTKPTTRLEIVLGKTLGFARVSAAILLIMGLFTAVYLQVRAWTLEHDIAYRLDNNAVDPISRPALEHYRQAGLLNAKTYAQTEDFQIYSSLPQVGDAHRFVGQMADAQILVPFDLTPDLFDQAANQNTVYHMRVQATLGTKLAPNAKPVATQPATKPTTQKLYGPSPLLSSTQPIEAPAVAGPTAIISGLSGDELVMIDSMQFNGGTPTPLNPDSETQVTADISSDGVNRLWAASRSNFTRRVYIAFGGSSADYLYYMDRGACFMQIAVEQPDHSIKSKTIFPAADPWEPGKTMAPLYRGGYSRYGQQFKGSVTDGSVAVYHFHNNIPTDGSKLVNFEMRLGIDRTGTESSDESDTITRLELQIRNRKTGSLSEIVNAQPETNRTLFFSFPASAVDGGDFELIIRCRTPQQQIGAKQSGLNMVIDSGHFYFNLLQSLFIFWLLTVLVVAVAIFCSTFVSWPIAVVLCVVILLGRWGVEQLGDSTRPGIGAQVATDFGFRDANQVRVVSESVETLTKFLNTVSQVLPDISQYPATEDIERGVSIPGEKVWDATKESFTFGLPLLLLGYVIFKNKEVAP